MKILITGDLVINHPYNTSNLDQSIIDLFTKSDLNIVNLEAPITKSSSKILKTGPHLKSDRESTLEVLKALEVDVVTLANNHVLDYDEQGVRDTLEFCKENDIKTVGAGMNLKEASQTLYLDTKERKIAIINFAENEWASATDESAGAHPMDIIDNAKAIKDAKGKADFVFVIVHGGHEYYNLPSPRMQKQYRFYADQGADIVVGHHTHCISGYEMYNGVPIYYSLGNFLFTKNNPNEEWYTGLVLEVEITSEGVECQIHPVRQEKESFKLSLLEDIDKEDVLCGFETYSNVINNPDELLNNWKMYIQKKSKEYLNYWSPLASIENRYISGILRRLGVNFINKKAATLHLNLMRCEAHHDLSEEILKKYMSK